jgi:hypothetical protein
MVLAGAQEMSLLTHIAADSRMELIQESLRGLPDFFAWPLPGPFGRGERVLRERAARAGARGRLPGNRADIRGADGHLIEAGQTTARPNPPQRRESADAGAQHAPIAPIARSGETIRMIRGMPVVDWTADAVPPRLR